jgi:excisionase family DNA binding protein
MDTNFEQLLDSQEAARLLGIHPKTLKQMARRGEVPAVRIGKFWRFRASALDSWVRSAVDSLTTRTYRETLEDHR